MELTVHYRGRDLTARYVLDHEYDALERRWLVAIRLQALTDDYTGADLYNNHSAFRAAEDQIIEAEK